MINMATYYIAYQAQGRICHGDSQAAVFDYQEKDGVRTLKGTFKQDAVILSAEMDLEDTMAKDEFFFANGYQSWTDTQEQSFKDKTRKAPLFVSLIEPLTHLKAFGDYNIVPYRKHYSFSFTYLRKGDTARFYGSLSEKSGYTVFYIDKKDRSLKAEKDIRGLHVKAGTEYVFFQIVALQGAVKEVFKAYDQAAFKGKELEVKTALNGFSTWYRYYSAIREEDCLRDISNIKKSGIPFRYFQLDDGYETFVGDWLEANKQTFPSGLKGLSQKIQEAGMLPGIWIAPFVIHPQSELYKAHPEYAFHDEKGRPVYAGESWGGAYIADIYNQEFRKYLHEVFQKRIKEGYRLFKLDFLYACSIKPREDKTRGQIMSEAMEFLAQELQGCLFIGCGVPLFPAFHHVDYCRIGMDIYFKSKGFFYDHLLVREVFNCAKSIVCTRYRAPLNGVFFLNDPDVITFKDATVSASQKKLIYEQANKYGSVFMTSDDVSSYSKEEILKWKEMCQK